MQDHPRPPIDWLLCLAASVIFLVLTFQDIRLPGPNYDEVYPAAPAVNFYENRYTTSPMQIDPSTIELFGRKLPLMLLTYVGSLQTILHIPTFYLFGDSIVVVRALPIVLAVVSIWFTYFFFLRLFDRNVAAITVLLVITDPGFLFYTGRNFGPPNIGLLCKMAGLWFALRWWEGGRLFPLMLAGFLWGLGLYHKTDFLWFLAAFALVLVVFHFRELRPRLTLRHLSLAGIAFCVGAAPFLALNCAVFGVSFLPLFQATSTPAAHGSYLENILVRAVQMVRLLNGSQSYSLFLDAPPNLTIVQLFLPPLIVLGSFLMLPLFTGSEVFPYRKRIVLALFAATVLIFLQTARVPFALGAHHMITVYPFLQAGAAVGLVSLGRLAFSKRAWRISFITLLLVATSCTGWWTIQYTYGSLEKTGGVGYWSDAVYELSDYLQAQGRPVVAMEWGFTNNLLVLSKGRLDIRRAYRAFAEGGTTGEAFSPFYDDSAIYLFHARGGPASGAPYDLLAAAASAHGSTIRMLKRFFQRDGRHVYTAFTLERTAS